VGKDGGSPQVGGAWKPSTEQEWLLQAALWQGADARDAWQKWIAHVNPEGLDGGSLRLLPLLYLNLRALSVHHPYVEHLRRVYQWHRRKSRVWLDVVPLALRVLAGAKIPTLLLKAGALIPLYYHDPAARPTKDIDVLVPTRRAQEALQALANTGWSPQERPLAEFDHTYLYRNCSHTLVNPQGIQLDLHLHVLMTETRLDGDQNFWAVSIPIVIEGVETRALYPADQLLHTILHGTEWNALPPIRWVADAYSILRYTEMDWERLVKQAIARELVLPTRTALTYLRDALRVTIPAFVLDALGQARVTQTDRLRYELLVHPHSQHDILDKLRYHLDQYTRLADIYTHSSWFEGFPLYLRDTWNLKKTSHVPLYMARYLLRRLNAQPPSHPT